MKRGMFLAMLGLLLVGWLTTIKGLTETPASYRRLVEEAREYEAQELYIRAIDSYQSALEYNPGSVEVQLAIAQDYLAIGDESAFTNRCAAINEAHGYPLSVVEPLADFYIENHRDEAAIDLLQKALKQHKKNEALQERYEKVRYTYQSLYVSADEIGLMANDSAVFVQEERYGLMTSGGNIRIRNSNEWCGPYSSDGRLTPVKADGQFYFADKNGYRYEVPPEGMEVEELGTLTGGAAPVKANGKYGYVNEKFELLSELAWDGATQLQNGLAAVKQGDRWALLNAKYELITDYVYEDVKTDENGFFCVNSRAFVKQGGSWQMINEKGEPVGSGGYEDAAAFAGEQPAAVKQNGKWGFADRDGNLVIEPQYENAGSFSNQLAPVETDGGWGYINLENHLAIEAKYSGAKSFYEGVAPVKDGDQWTLIELNVKK